MAAPGELRHLHLHGPHLRAAGRGDSRRRRAAALILPVLLISAFFAGACGGDDDDDSGGDGLEASALVPNLESLGYGVLQEGRDPLAPDDLDMYRALYGVQGVSGQNVIVIAYVQSSEETAGGQFVQVKNAYSTMPRSALLDNPLTAGDPANQPPANEAIEDGPQLGDEQAWFRTNQPDSRGNHVWSDVYRLGRAVVVVQVLNDDVAAATQTRQAVAEASLAAAQ